MIDDDSRRGVNQKPLQRQGRIFQGRGGRSTMHELIARTEESHKAQLRCLRRTTGGVIYDEARCRLREPGPGRKPARLRLEFWALWNSPELNARRGQIKQGCYCARDFYQHAVRV